MVDRLNAFLKQICEKATEHIAAGKDRVHGCRILTSIPLPDWQKLKYYFISKFVANNWGMQINGLCGGGISDGKNKKIWICLLPAPLDPVFIEDYTTLNDSDLKEAQEAVDFYHHTPEITY